MGVAQRKGFLVGGFAILNLFFALPFYAFTLHSYGFIVVLNLFAGVLAQLAAICYLITLIRRKTDKNENGQKEMKITVEKEDENEW